MFRELVLGEVWYRSITTIVLELASCEVIIAWDFSVISPAMGRPTSNMNIYPRQNLVNLGSEYISKLRCVNKSVRFGGLGIKHFHCVGQY